MSRNCNIVTPEEALQFSAGQVVLTRELFDLHMQNVAFRSWEDLLAALAGKPTQHGYAGKHGASGTVVKLDPTRIFGWTATLLINICIWGLVGYFCSHSTVLGIALTAAYGLALWRLVETSLVPQLAGVLWPLIPVAASAAGLLLARLLVSELQVVDESDRVWVVSYLLLCACPHVAVAAILLRGVQRDPDRATLVVNLVAGAYAAVLLLYWAVSGTDDRSGYGVYWFGTWELFLVGAAAAVVGLRLFVNPGEWGSAECVSWTLNTGALALFLSAGLLLEVPWSEGLWRWLLYLPAVLCVGLLGAVSDRSFPLLLTALGLAQVSGRAAMAISMLMPEGFAEVACFASFGAIGVAIVGVGQWLQNSAWWEKVTMEMRCALARAFGSQDLPYSWSRTAQASLSAGGTELQ